MLNSNEDIVSPCLVPIVVAKMKENFPLTHIVSGFGNNNNNNNNNYYHNNSNDNNNNIKLMSVNDPNIL